ncbi:hypothetical protein [Luedemannella helvata]|uniref:DUF4386 family protein n=1 Tax=Luedemannella helvata TaxID=349315 RepID=A0ABN2K068_9ACTN
MTATTTSEVAPAAGTAAPALPTRIYGVAAVLAAILLVASTIAFIVRGGFTNDAMNNGILGGTLVVWTVFALILTFAGVSRLMEPRFRRWSKALLILSATYAASVGFGLHSIDMEYYGRSFDADNELATGQQVIGFFAMYPWGALGPVTFILIGVLLWRAGQVPAWAGIVLVAGGVLFIPGREGNIGLTVATDILLFVGLLAIARALLAAARRDA